MGKIPVGKEHWIIQWVYGSGPKLNMSNTKSSNVPSNWISGTSIVIPNAKYAVAFFELYAPYGVTNIQITAAVQSETINLTQNYLLSGSTLHMSTYSGIYAFEKIIGITLSSTQVNYSTVPLSIHIYLLETYTS